MPRIPFCLAKAAINAEPIIDPGIPAATVRPDFIPEYAVDAAKITARIIPIIKTTVFPPDLEPVEIYGT